MFCPLPTIYSWPLTERKSFLMPSWKSSHYRICFLLCSLFSLILVKLPHHEAQAGSFSVLTTTIDWPLVFFTSIVPIITIVVRIAFLLLFLSIIVVHNFFKLKRKKRKSAAFCCPGSPFHPSLVLSLTWLMLYGLRLLNRRVIIVCLIRNHDFPANCSNLGCTSRWSYT